MLDNRNYRTETGYPVDKYPDTTSTQTRDAVDKDPAPDKHQTRYSTSMTNDALSDAERSFYVTSKRSAVQLEQSSVTESDTPIQLSRLPEGMMRTNQHQQH